jgi:hypothetical protein
MEKVIGGCRKLHNDQLCFLYWSQNIIKLTMEEEWASHGIWHTWESTDMLTGFWWENW